MYFSSRGSWITFSWLLFAYINQYKQYLSVLDIYLINRLLLPVCLCTYTTYLYKYYNDHIILWQGEILQLWLLILLGFAIELLTIDTS